MNLRIGVAAAAMLALSAASRADADDALSYAQLTNCAAFNMLLMQSYSLGDQAAAHQDDIAISKRRSMALTLAAAMLSKQDSKVVADDVVSQNAAMIKSLSDAEAAAKLVTDNMTPCATLGKVADEALNEQ